MASELSVGVRRQILILGKEGLSQRQIMARLKVSKGAVRGTDALCGERTGCIQATVGQAKGHHAAGRLVHRTLLPDGFEGNVIADPESVE